jgi:recombination protein RecT
MNNGLAQKAAANAVQRQEGEGKAPSIPSLLNARWLAEQLQRQMGGTPEEAQSFVRSVITATKAAPDLLRCDPETIYGGMFAAAQLGLPIGGGLKQAYLIPRKDRNSPTGWSASFQVGYPGLIKLAANSGLVVGVDTIRVMKGDRFRQGATSERGKFFDLSFGDDHDSTDDNDIVGVIGMVYQLNRKEPRWVYMSRRQVERRRPDFTKEQTGQNGPYIPNTPWKTDWGAMAEKTVVIEALKFAPKSEKLQLAVTMDEATVTQAEGSTEMRVTRPDQPGTGTETIENGTQSAPAATNPPSTGTPTGGAAPSQPTPAPASTAPEPSPFPDEPTDSDYDAPPDDFWSKSGPELGQ